MATYLYVGDEMYLKKIAGTGFILLASLCLILKKDECVAGALAGLTMCGEVMIPSIFPFAVIADIAFRAGLFLPRDKIIKAVFRRLFGLPMCCLPAIIFGFSCGYPVGMNITAELYSNGNITKNNARRLMTFCVNAGPAFTVAAVGGIILGSKKAGIVLSVAVFGASFICSVISRLLFGNTEKSAPQSDKIYRECDFLVNSVTSACGKTVTLCGWVILFSIFNSVVRSFLTNDTVISVYSVFSEVTSGVVFAAKLGGLPLVAFCVAFGGCCVMLQLVPNIKKCGCKVSEYLTFRILNGFFAYILTEIILLFIDVPVTVSAVGDYQMWSISAPASASLMAMCAVFVFDMASHKPQKMQLGDFFG